MNAVATIPTKSVTIDMANRYGMEPAAFEATLRQTIMPMSRGTMMQPTREEFAAFLLVAREYRLNPITRQIYAFPKKGGGIIPVVSVDGWAFLINEHPAFDGMEFEDAHNDKGHLLSVTCRIFRKDRRMPVSVTEYLSECKRDTDPWAMQHRMLRHKALIQCARYAFAFSGIYDEDEAEKFAALPQAVIRNDTPPAAQPQISSEPPAAPRQIEHTPSQNTAQPVSRAPVQDAEVSSGGDPEPATPASANSEENVVAMDSLLGELDDRLGYAADAISLEEAYTDFDAEALLSGYEGGVEAGRKLKARHLDRVGTSLHTMLSALAEKAEPVDDFPGNEALERARAQHPPGLRDAVNPALVSTKDPFAVPEQFKGGGHYQTWIRGACSAAISPADEDRLRLIWGKTKPARDALAAEGQIDNTVVKLLLDEMKTTFARIQEAAQAEDQPQDDALPPPAPRRAAQAAQAAQEPPAAPQATKPTPEPPAPASGDPVAAYTDRLGAMLAAATTKDGLQKAWLSDADVRDETGAGEAQRLTWKAAMQRRKSELPEG